MKSSRRTRLQNEDINQFEFDFSVLFKRVLICRKFMMTQGEGKQDENLRSSPFWDITQPVVVFPSGRFGTTYRSHLHESIIGIDPPL